VNWIRHIKILQSLVKIGYPFPTINPFLKAKCHNLAIDKVSYSEILGGCILTSSLKDTTIRFVNE